MRSPLKPKRNKYGAKPVETPEGRFDSQKEFRRWCALKLLRDAGHIENLKRQVPFQLRAEGGELVGQYIADFTYTEDGDWIVEDCKGHPTQLYQWKRRHLNAQYKVEIRET